MEQGDRLVGRERHATASLKRRPFSAVAVVGAAVVLILLAHTLATGDFAPLRLGGVRHGVNNGVLVGPQQQQQPQNARLPAPIPGELNLQSARLTAIAGTSPSDIWLAGEYDGGSGAGAQEFLLHYDGVQWSRAADQAQQSISDISMVAPDDGWAVAGSAILHYSGGAWQVFGQQPPGVAPGGYMQSVSMSSPDDGWIVGALPANGNSPVGSLLLHYTGGQWTPYTRPSLALNTNLFSVSMYAPNDGWAVGNQFTTDAVVGVVAHYQDGAWTQVGSLHGASLFRVAAAGPNEAWAVGVGGPTSGILVHCLDGSCQQVDSPTPNILSVVSEHTPDEGWIGGDGAVIFHRQGDLWTQRMPTYHQVSLVGLLAFSDVDGWAIGQSNGTSLPSGAVIFRCVNGTWQVYPLHVPWGNG